MKNEWRHRFTDYRNIVFKWIKGAFLGTHARLQVLFCFICFVLFRTMTTADANYSPRTDTSTIGFIKTNRPKKYKGTAVDDPREEVEARPRTAPLISGRRVKLQARQQRRSGGRQRLMIREKKWRIPKAKIPSSCPRNFWWNAALSHCVFPESAAPMP